jgi:protein phosphatase
MKIAYQTFIGTPFHHTNEDALAVVCHLYKNQYMFIVCDGMGGHNHGEIASRTVTKAFCRYWSEHWEEALTPQKIEDAARYASKALNRKQPQCDMATTMAMVCVEENKAFQTYCGDSRIYSIKMNPCLIIYSKDHVIKDEMGVNRITKAFRQGNKDVEGFIPPVESCNMEPGDLCLICTDGVWRTLPDADLYRFFWNWQDKYTFEEMAEQLEEYCKTMANDDFAAILIQRVE